jgi:fluoroquinolone transport system ATP-binding protein
LLELVGLADDADKRVENYSKGMKMRLNFVRGLLNNPRLLFMDEPTTGLDPVNAANIKDIVRELRANGTTIFLTTHDMAVADDLCDRVAFIVDGQIKLIDAPRPQVAARHA